MACLLGRSRGRAGWSRLAGRRSRWLVEIGRSKFALACLLGRSRDRQRARFRGSADQTFSRPPGQRPTSRHRSVCAVNGRPSSKRTCGNYVLEKVVGRRRSRSLGRPLDRPHRRVLPPQRSRRRRKAAVRDARNDRDVRSATIGGCALDLLAARSIALVVLRPQRSRRSRNSAVRDARSDRDVRNDLGGHDFRRSRCLQRSRCPQRSRWSRLPPFAMPATIAMSMVGVARARVAARSIALSVACSDRSDLAGHGIPVRDA
jgi:hypothetical protein